MPGLILTLKILGILAVIYVAICLLACSLQHKLTYYPSAYVEYNPQMVGLEFENVKLQSKDANGDNPVEIHGWFVPNSDARGTMLFLHGNGGNISHRLDSIHQFHKMGLNVFIIDYRGYGRSQGKSYEAGLYGDAHTAWNYLTMNRKIPKEEIVFFGRSLGGAVAAWLAAHLGKKHQPAALILESTFTSLPDVGAKIYPWLPVRLMAREKYPTIDRLQNIKCPILIAHSPDDDLVPYSLSKRLYEAAPEPRQFFEMSGDHNNGFMEMGEAYTNAIQDFLNK
ncbi:MAG: alpha/beta hydrolase, partial [Candidatus Sumerlaeia bacterium]